MGLCGSCNKEPFESIIQPTTSKPTHNSGRTSDLDSKPLEYFQQESEYHGLIQRIDSISQSGEIEKCKMYGNMTGQKNIQS